MHGRPAGRLIRSAGRLSPAAAGEAATPAPLVRSMLLHTGTSRAFTLARQGQVFSAFRPAPASKRLARRRATASGSAPHRSLGTGRPAGPPCAVDAPPAAGGSGGSGARPPASGPPRTPAGRRALRGARAAAACSGPPPTRAGPAPRRQTPAPEPRQARARGLAPQGSREDGSGRPKPPRRG